jgi:circadian clock protein KaiC
MDIVERIREKDPTATAQSLVASIREYVAALNA